MATCGMITERLMSSMSCAGETQAAQHPRWCPILSFAAAVQRANASHAATSTAQPDLMQTRASKAERVANRKAQPGQAGGAADQRLTSNSKPSLQCLHALTLSLPLSHPGWHAADRPSTVGSIHTRHSHQAASMSHHTGTFALTEEGICQASSPAQEQGPRACSHGAGGMGTRRHDIRVSALLELLQSCGEAQRSGVDGCTALADAGEAPGIRLMGTSCMDAGAEQHADVRSWCLEAESCLQNLA